MGFDPQRPFEVTAIAMVDKPEITTQKGHRFVYGAAFNLMGGRILQSAAKLDPSVEGELIFNRNVDPRTEPLRSEHNG